jgi:predicted esterase
VTRASVAALVLTALGAGACGGGDDDRAAAPSSRAAVTTTATRRECGPGIHEFTLRNGRPARMMVTRPAQRPYALVVALHGSGGSPAGAIEAFAGAWDVPGLVFVAPEAKGPTWSVIYSDQDLDLESVDLAVAATWARCPLAHDRLVLGGFSDGATYALSLGVANGDLFPAIIAFSPGGILADTRRARPRIFVSHGTRDKVLPIAGASDTIVPVLRRAGYDVTYRRFRGDHEVPSPVAEAAVRWFLAGLD